jgi:hypothetical protein
VLDIFQARGTLLPLIKEAFSREIENSQTAETLLRGESVATLLLAAYYKRVGVGCFHLCADIEGGELSACECENVSNYVGGLSSWRIEREVSELSLHSRVCVCLFVCFQSILFLCVCVPVVVLPLL